MTSVKSYLFMHKILIICLVEGYIFIITTITSRELFRNYGLDEINIDSGAKIKESTIVEIYYQ
jgi:hypothetical protein